MIIFSHFNFQIFCISDFSFVLVLSLYVGYMLWSVSQYVYSNTASRRKLQCYLFLSRCLSHRYHNLHYVLSTSNKYKWNKYHRKRVQKLWEERLKIEEYNKKFLEDNEKFIPTDKKGLFRQDEFYYSDLDAT